MEILTDAQNELLEEVARQCARRGWFFINATKSHQIQDMNALEKLRLVVIEERDVRYDPTSDRVRAGEFVGKLNET